MLERLQKIIARAGISSRRHAEQLILSGQVRVNGQLVTELGSKADAEHDRIEAAGKLVESNERRVYIVLNKPPEVVSTLADPEGRKTLRNCLKGLPERVYPVGRLDYDASGLVFLTNDGDLAAEMLKDWSNLQQIYHVKIKGRLLMEDLERLGRNSASTIRTVRQPDATRGHAENFWYEVTLQDSKKDILRRVLFAEHHPVEKLKRIGLGSLDLEGLPQGRYRLLIDKEVAELRRVLKIKPKPRSTFVPSAESAPPVRSPTLARPFSSSKPRYAPAANRGGHSKHGPRPSRPPSPNRLEAQDREDFQRENERPRRTGAPYRSGPPNRPRFPDQPGAPEQPGAPPAFRGPGRPPSQRSPFNRPDSPRPDSPRFASNRPSSGRSGSSRSDRPSGPNRSKWNPNRGPHRGPNRSGPSRPASGSRGPSFSGRPPRPGNRPDSRQGARSDGRPDNAHRGASSGSSFRGPRAPRSGPGDSRSGPGGPRKGPGNFRNGKSSGKPFRPKGPPRDRGPR